MRCRRRERHGALDRRLLKPGRSAGLTAPPCSGGCTLAGPTGPALHPAGSAGAEGGRTAAWGGGHSSVTRISCTPQLISARTGAASCKLRLRRLPTVSSSKHAGAQLRGARAVGQLWAACGVRQLATQSFGSISQDMAAEPRLERRFEDSQACRRCLVHAWRFQPPARVAAGRPTVPRCACRPWLCRTRMGASATLCKCRRGASLCWVSRRRWPPAAPPLSPPLTLPPARPPWQLGHGIGCADGSSNAVAGHPRGAGAARVWDQVSAGAAASTVWDAVRRPQMIDGSAMVQRAAAGRDSSPHTLTRAPDLCCLRLCRCMPRARERTQ